MQLGNRLQLVSGDGNTFAKHAGLIRNANFHWILADLEGFNRFHWTESPSFC